MKRILFGVLAFILVLVLSYYILDNSQKAKAADTTYYVDATGGLDANNGLSEGAAWKTIGKVNTAMDTAVIHAGDTVLFKRGETFAGYLDIDVTGTVGNILTFGAYSLGNKPIINATGNNNGIDSRNNMSYITIQDLVVSNATTNEIFIYNSASYVTIDNVDLNTAGATGIDITTGNFSNISINNLTTASVPLPAQIYAFSSLADLTVNQSSFNYGTSYNFKLENTAGSCSDINIQNSHMNHGGGRGLGISRCDDIDIIDTEVSNNNSYGVDLNYNINGVNIDGLTADNNSSSGLHLNASGADSVRNVVIKDTELNENGGNGLSLSGNGDIADIINVDASYNHGDGFNVHDSWTNVDIDYSSASDNGDVGVGGSGDGYSFHETCTGSITNSVASNNLKSAIAHVGSSQVTMENNIFSHLTNGTIALVYVEGTGSYTMHNNTLYSAAHIGDGLGVHGPTFVAKNNIIYGFSNGFVLTSGIATDDYNDVYGANNPYSGVTPGAHSIQFDPKLVNPPTDFSLQSTSPAIDAGVSTNAPTTDYLGSSRYDNPNIANTGGGILPYYDIGAYEVTTAICPAPTVSSTSPTSLTVIVASNGNTDPVELAIYNNTAAKYVQADGTLGAGAVWQTRAAWGGGSGIVNTGLSPNTSYTYKVKERGVDNVETALSTGTSQSTQAAAPTPTPTATTTATTTPTESATATPSEESSTEETTTSSWRRWLPWLTGASTDTSSESFDIITNITEVESGQEIVFDASSLGDNIAKYEWNFGDGTTSDKKTVSHKFEKPGRYTVTLTTTDKSGNKSTYTKIIDIRPPAPTISDIKADGTSIVFEGKSFPETTVNLTIHSNPYSGQAVADKDGEFTYTVEEGSETLGEGDHTVFASASVILSDNTQLKSKDSKTYDFKVSVDNGKLKVEMGKTKTWKIISIILGGIIIIGLVVAILRRRKGFRRMTMN